MKYEIVIMETLARIIEVEADNSMEAKDKVWKDYRDCNIVLGSEDHLLTEIF